MLYYMATHYQKTYRVNQTNSMSYTEIEADFSRKFSLAKKIDANRTLLQVGLDNIERWAKLHGDLPRAHEEWRNLIEGEPWEKLRDMLIEESDEGQRLRSSSPFAGIVTPAERERILAAKGEPPPATKARARTRKARRYVGIPTHRNR